MPRFEGIVLTLAHFGKTADPLVLAQGVESVPATGDQFVGIALVAQINLSTGVLNT